MELKFKRALVLAPHIDDVEFGCGGTISKLIEQGTEVMYIAFSDCKESISKDLPEDTLRSELINSIDAIGIERKNVKVLDFKVRYFYESRQKVLQELVDLRSEFKPDVIFTPSQADIHQDHKVITEECIRAFKHSTIFGYELPWNCLSFSYDTLVSLDESNIIAKIKSINCYQSQAHRIYHSEEYIRAMAMTRGLKINVRYAEVFELIRLVI